MGIIKKNRKLYVGVLLLSVTLVLMATGGGLTGFGSFGMAGWQHEAFRMLCHQDPSRAFLFDGQPMAVCSRCYGVYTGFSLLWIFVPFLSFLTNRNRIHGKYILLVIIINLADVLGNYMDFWQNSLASRFFMGNLIGITAAGFLTADFVKT